MQNGLKVEISMENNNGKEEAEDNRKIRQRDTGKGKKTNDKTR